MHSSAFLTVLIVVPLVGALLAAIAHKTPGLSYAIGVVTAAVEMVLATIVAFLYNPHIAGAGTWDFATRHVLSAPLGLAYDVALDGISLLMVRWSCYWRCSGRATNGARPRSLAGCWR
jgi:NADH:ubiquinone oxidoreductase subunit 4 (subunit M)